MNLATIVEILGVAIGLVGILSGSGLVMDTESGSIPPRRTRTSNESVLAKTVRFIRPVSPILIAAGIVGILIIFFPEKQSSSVVIENLTIPNEITIIIATPIPSLLPTVTPPVTAEPLLTTTPTTTATPVVTPSPTSVTMGIPESMTCQLLLILPTNNDCGFLPPTLIIGYHQVVRGETLYCIGRAYGVVPAAISKANSLSSSRIFPGDLLRIPAAGWYPVPSGQTCCPQFTSPFPSQHCLNRP